MVLLWARPQGSACYKGKRTRSPKAIDGGAELEAAVASDAAPLMAAQTRKQRCSLFSDARTLNRHRDKAAAVAGRWASGRKGEGTRGLRGQSAATQTAPKFGPRLHPRGQADENALGWWEHFFPSRSKLDRFGRPRSICVGPLEMPLGH
jgi:hypothetical protein